MTKKKSKDTVIIHVYNDVEKMDRKEAMKKYLLGIACCEGCERDRYTNIYLQLIAGETECYDSIY